MRAVVYVEVDDAWLRDYLEEVYAEIPSPERPPPLHEFLRDRLEEVAGDELRLALFGWPIETLVEVYPGPRNVRPTAGDETSGKSETSTTDA